MCRRFRARCILIGKWFHVNFWDMSNWSRGMIVPLAIINHFKPTRPVKVDLDELYPEGIHERDLALAPDPKQFRCATFSCGWTACTSWPSGSPSTKSTRSAGPRSRRPSNGCWNDLKARTGWRRFFPAMLNSLIALKALGYPDDHPQVVRAAHELKKLEHETEDTTCASSRASRRSGIPPSSPCACTNRAFRKIIRC